MSYILVVFQLVTYSAGAEYYGFYSLGEFKTYDACRIASEQLVESTKGKHYSERMGSPRFTCVKKD